MWKYRNVSTIEESGMEISYRLVSFSGRKYLFNLDKPSPSPSPIERLSTILLQQRCILIVSIRAWMDLHLTTFCVRHINKGSMDPQHRLQANYDMGKLRTWVLYTLTFWGDKQVPGGVVSLRLVSLIHLASWTWRNLCGWSCPLSPNRGEGPQTGQEGKESLGSICDETHHHSVLLLHGGVSAPRPKIPRPSYLSQHCSMLADSVQNCLRRDVF